VKINPSLGLRLSLTMLVVIATSAGCGQPKPPSPRATLATEAFYSTRNPAELVAVAVEALQAQGYEVTRASSAEGLVFGARRDSLDPDERAELGNAKSMVIVAHVGITSDRQFCCYVMGGFEVAALNRAGDTVLVDASARTLIAKKARESFFAQMTWRLPWELSYGNVPPPLYPAALAQTDRSAPAKMSQERVCVVTAPGGYVLAALGDVRMRLSRSNVVVYNLSLVDQGKPTSGAIPYDLAQEGGYFWPNHRVVCGNNKLTVTKVDPIKLPRRTKETWLDYKQWEITLDGEQRVITPEKLVFKAPRLSSSDVRTIKANYRRLEEQGDPRDGNKVETLLGQVFLWALQDPAGGVAALKGFRATFHPDGIYGEAESTYREMYEEITGRALVF
jgi:hypothetical protein